MNRAEIVKQVLLHRRSVRQFRDCPIARRELNDILEAAIYAPSGSNSQNQRLLVIEEKEELQALGEIRFVWPYPTARGMRRKIPAGLIGGAAAAVVVFSEAALTEGRDNGEYFIWETLEIQNAAASIENMLIMATALGIGSCWISAGEKMTRTRLLSGRTWAKTLARYAIPESFKIQGIVIFGYPRGKMDDDGFPMGEKEHGATFWHATKRHELDHYLVHKGDPTNASNIRITWTDRIKLLAFSKISGLLLLLVQLVDKMVHDVEIKHALAKALEHKLKSERDPSGSH